jgi:hypothetical protein
MELRKGKFTIVCRHVNGKTEIFDTDEYTLTNNNSSIVFIDINNPKIDSLTKKPLPITLPYILCKVEGGDVK